jgi:hypothetical protein
MRTRKQTENLVLFWAGFLFTCAMLIVIFIIASVGSSAEPFLNQASTKQRSDGVHLTHNCPSYTEHPECENDHLKKENERLKQKIATVEATHEKMLHYFGEEITTKNILVLVDKFARVCEKVDFAINAASVSFAVVGLMFLLGLAI